MGGDRLALISKSPASSLELVKKDMIGIKMIHSLVPSILDHLLEHGHLDQNDFKAEQFCSHRALFICKSGQWSESDEERAWRMREPNLISQSSLQKKLSRLLIVGSFCSLLQVYFLF